jgi:hypothetical protein
MVGAAAPFHTTGFGKPAPGPDGKIRIDFSSQVMSWPLPGGVYEARMSAVGPGGAGRSEVSNQFQFAACAYALSTATASVGAQSGSTTVGVTAPAGCAWTASTSASWITLITTSGTANGTVSLSYATNPASTARSGVVTIGGQAFTLTQNGTPCTYAVSPATVSLPSGGAGNVATTVTTAAGCAWTASTAASWITVTAPSGSGTSSVTFNVEANGTAATRTATITVGGQAVTVTQPGKTPPATPRNLRLTASAQ